MEAVDLERNCKEFKKDEGGDENQEDEKTVSARTFKVSE